MKTISQLLPVCLLFVAAIVACTPWGHRDGQCGSWQQAYSEHHSSVLLGIAPPKHLVVETFSGLADALALISGMLFVAILSGRALRIQEDLPFTAVYDQPNIDWSWSRSDNRSDLSAKSVSLSTMGELPVDNPILHVLRNGSLQDMDPDIDILKITGNVGVINVLFDNPLYQQQLYRMGLRPETAFGCAVDFLFAPAVAVRKYFVKEFELMSSSFFKIGIQIRLGDGYLAGGADTKYAEASLSDVRHFFDCAQFLEDSFKQQDQGTIWLLMSDSLKVRTQAKAIFGKQLSTKLDPPGHSKHTSGSQQIQAMIYAAGEHWLFGMADYHVISNLNSFGKSAALRSRKWHSMYQMDVRTTNGQVCDGAKAVEFSQLLAIPPFI